MALFQSEKPLLWGRNATEYKAMFNLFDLNPDISILDVAGGPASVNAELSEAGTYIVSTDPIYAWSSEDIFTAIQNGRDTIMTGVEANKDMFNWNIYKSAADLENTRLHAMQFFLDDYEAGLSEGRYVPGSLPELPFPTGQFDMALCSHFLFTYAEQLGRDFMEQAVLELMRVALEARIFPLVDLSGKVSLHLGHIVKLLESAGYGVTQEPIPFDFIKGATHMLRITTPETADD